MRRTSYLSPKAKSVPHSALSPLPSHNLKIVDSWPVPEAAVTSTEHTGQRTLQLWKVPERLARVLRFWSCQPDRLAGICSTGGYHNHSSTEENTIWNNLSDFDNHLFTFKQEGIKLSPHPYIEYRLESAFCQLKNVKMETFYGKLVVV